MEQNIEKLKNNMLEDYIKKVSECFYFASISWIIDENIQKIKDVFNLDSINDYESIVKQFNSLEKEDLSYILDLLKIESEDDWWNANRCEASALTLWKYIFD